MSNKSSVFRYLQIFTIVYLFVPSYFYVGGMSFRSLFLLFSFIVLLFLSRFQFPIIVKGRNNGNVVWIYIWALLLTCIALRYQHLYSVITWSVPWMLILPYYVKYVNTKERFVDILDPVISMSFVISIFAIVEGFTHFNIFELLNTSGYISDAGDRLGFLRVNSFTLQPIIYSLFCLFIECLIFYLLSLSVCRRKKFYKVTYVTVFASAVLTFSRSSIILMIISQFVLLWLCGYKVFVKRALELIVLGVLAITIISALFPKVYEMLNSASILVLAVFSDSYAQQLKALGYDWDPTGVADRFELWGAIFDYMKGHFLLGYGPSAGLKGLYRVNYLGNNFEKHSIEVQFLKQLFRYGIIAAVIEEIRNIAQIKYAINNWKKKAVWENKLGFNLLCAILLIVYFLALITVDETDKERIYMIVVILLLAYNRNKLYEGDRFE